jgi:hypothetical protein
MFAEAVSKGATEKLAPAVAHKKCVVTFSVRVDKGKDTQAAFGKLNIAALSFLQMHIDKQAAFFAINGLVSDRPPIKEKADLPGFQVILCRYFAIPSDRAFDNVNQDGGRAIRGSAVMGFLLIHKNVSMRPRGTYDTWSVRSISSNVRRSIRLCACYCSVHPTRLKRRSSGRRSTRNSSK